MNRAKVVLYNPKAVFFDMPLALLAVGSALDPQQFEVAIIDGRLVDDAHQRVLAELDGAFCLGITVLTGRPIVDAMELSRKVRARFPKVPIVWGGWHPSIFPKDAIEEGIADVCVKGQGELSFARWLEARLKNQSGPVAGCYQRSQEGQWQIGAPVPLSDPNQFRSLDYSLIQVEDYFEKKGRRQLDYISSFGCRYRCAFCADPHVYKRSWSGFTAERVVTELRDLVEAYRVTDINFQDETFFTDRDRSLAIAKGITGLSVSWAATLRADQGSRLSEQEWDLLVKSGMRRVLIGVESGSPEMLVKIQKDLKHEQVWLCAERAVKRGVAAIFPFIVGFPDESEQSVDDSLRMAAKLRAMSSQFATPVFYYKPYPGTALTPSDDVAGVKLPSGLYEWSEFDYVDDRGPWVSDSKYRKVEAYKFFNDLGYAKAKGWLWPLRWIARMRCEKLMLRVPLERFLLGRWNRRSRVTADVN